MTSVQVRTQSMLTVQNRRCSVWRSCIYAPRRRRDKDTTASTNLEFRGAWVEILGELAMNLATLD